ncbi:hypothetical protein ACP70R_043170 [Stipagrostis hirtigluma subsp. patula]
MSHGFPTTGSERPPGEPPPRAVFVSLAMCLLFVSFGILLLTALAFCCRRSRDRTGSEREYSARAANPFPVDTLPAIAYARRSDEPGEGGGPECAVCLGAVREGEMVRRLPACAHVYHVECIDRWLAAHRTCPLCRSVLGPGKVASDTQPQVQDDPPDLLPV